MPSQDCSESNVLPGGFHINYPLFVRGEGVYLLDESGNRYLDAIGGVGVVNVGHGVAPIVDAMVTQARKLAFSYGSTTRNHPREELATIIQALAPAEMGATKTSFCSGGSEANETALKIAVQYHRETGHPTKTKVVSRWHSYHGNTIAALSMSGRSEWRRPFSSLLLDFPHIGPPYCYRCPWAQTYPSCDLQCAHELERVICLEGPENVAAFIAEPIIGTTLSAVCPPREYYSVVREICDAYGVLFIADEVMSGCGRTGRFFAIDHWGVVPDIITLGKGISGGYSPLAAVVLAESVWRAFASGSGRVSHGFTFGGNPLSCAVGVATLRRIEQYDLIARAHSEGEKLLAELKEALSTIPVVGDIRGMGLFIGIELVSDRASKEPFQTELDVTHRVVDAARRHKLLVLGGITGNVDGVDGDHFEILPPYTIGEVHRTAIVKALKVSLQEVAASISEDFMAQQERRTSGEPNP